MCPDVLIPSVVQDDVVQPHYNPILSLHALLVTGGKICLHVLPKNPADVAYPVIGCKMLLMLMLSNNRFGWMTLQLAARSNSAHEDTMVRHVSTVAEAKNSIALAERLPPLCSKEQGLVQVVIMPEAMLFRSSSCVSRA